MSGNADKTAVVVKEEKVPCKADEEETDQTHTFTLKECIDFTEEDEVG